MDIHYYLHPPFSGNLWQFSFTENSFSTKFIHQTVLATVPPVCKALLH
jgi:hypothetical protein